MHNRYHSRKAKPEFALTAVIAGIIAGTFIGFTIEVGAGGGELAMAAGAFAGLIIGALCETCRFLWRKQASAKKPPRATHTSRRQR